MSITVLLTSLTTIIGPMTWELSELYGNPNAYIVSDAADVVFDTVI